MSARSRSLTIRGRGGSNQLNMRIDTDLVFATIEALIHDRASVTTKMSRVIDACEAGYPHDGWQSLRLLPYDEDVATLRAWIPDVFHAEAPSFEVRGLWIGIGNYLFDGRETADMHVVASATYDADDRDQNWALDAEYRPESGAARSAILDSIYDLAYRKYPDLENNAEWSLCLAYGAFAVAEILRDQTPASAASRSEIGVVVGFDEGDSVTIGNLTADGLKALT